MERSERARKINLLCKKIAELAKNVPFDKKDYKKYFGLHFRDEFDVFWVLCFKSDEFIEELYDKFIENN